MESKVQKDEDITAQTLLNQIFIQTNEKGGDYLGFLNERLKTNIFSKISLFLLSKNLISEEKLIFITKLHTIFYENPDIMAILCNINVVKDIKESLYYQFVNLYLNIIFSDTKINDTLTQLKTALLDILNLLIHNVDCPHSIYEFLYSHISSFYLNQDKHISNEQFQEYLLLVEVLYGSRQLKQSSSSFPKSFFYCQGKNALMLNQYYKTIAKDSLGIKIYAWLYIKKNRQYIDQVNQISIDSEEQKKEETNSVGDIKQNKCCLLHMVFGKTKNKVFQITLDKDYKNVEINYETSKANSEQRKSNPQQPSIVYKTPRSKAILEMIEKQKEKGDKNIESNEIIPTKIPIETEGWYLLTVSFRGYGPSFKNTMVTVKLTNTETKQTKKIRLEVARTPFLTDNTSYQFFKNFYGVVTSIIKTQEAFRLKQYNGQDKQFFSHGIVNQKTMDSFHNFLIESKQKGLLICLISPQNYSEREMVVEDIINGYYFNLNDIQNAQQTSFDMINRYGVHIFTHKLKKLYLIGGINSLLPFFDLIFIKHNELLTTTTFELLCKLIAELCIKSKANLLDACQTNFFSAFGLFLQKIPSEFFTPNIYIYIELIINYYLPNYEFLLKNTSDNPLGRVGFLESIILNYKITFKYDPAVQAYINGRIYDILYGSKAIIPKEDYKHIINSEILCKVLRILDKQRYSKFCCDYHFEMVNIKNDYNRIISVPSISGKLLSFEHIVTNFLREDLLNENKLPLLIKMLLLDISPCLQAFIVEKILKVIINYMGNKIEEVLTKLLNDNFLQIMLYTYMISLSDVKINILSLLLWCYREHNEILDNTIFEIGNSKVGATDLMFAFLKENIIPHYLLKRNNSKVSHIQRAKSNKNFFETVYKENLINSELKLPKRKNSNRNKRRQKIDSIENKKRSNSVIEKNLSYIINSCNKQKKDNINSIQSNNSTSSPIQINSKFKAKYKKYIKEFPNKYPERTEEFIQDIIYIENIDKKINFQEIYKIIFFDTVIKVKSTKPLLTLTILDLLIHFLISANNFDVISSFLSDLNTMIFSDLNLELDSQPTNNDYIYFQKKLHHWLLETALHLFLIKQSNYKNVKSVFFGDITIPQLDEASIKTIEKVLNQCFEVHKKLILLYLKRKAHLKNNHNLHYLFTWLVYQKMIMSLYLEPNKVETFQMNLDLFIKTLLKNIIEEYKKFPENNSIINLSSSSWKNEVIFGNMISQYAWIGCSSDIIFNMINHAEGYLDIGKEFINMPMFLLWKDKDANITNQIEKMELWSNFSIFQEFCAYFQSIFSIDALCTGNVSCNTSQKIENIVNNVIYNKNTDTTRFENMIFILTLSSELYDVINEIIKENKNLTFNEDSPFTTRTMSLIKIISLFYVSTITPGSLKLITDYERFLLYIIIASSAMNYNKKIDKNLKFQAINEICYQVISFGLIFLFQQINHSIKSNSNDRMFIDSVNVLLFSIKKILTHKKVSNISTSPIYKLFKEDIGKKNPLLSPESYKIKVIGLTDMDKCYISDNRDIKEFWENKLIKNQIIAQHDKNYFNKSIIKDFFHKILFEVTHLIPIYKNFEAIIGKKFSHNSKEVPYKLMVSPLYFDNDYINYYNGFTKTIISLAKEVVKSLAQISYKKKEITVEKIQIYRRIKKQLFSWRGLWSDKDVFYSPTGKKKFKRKVINHYSLDMANPLLGPILDVNYYLPKFKYFDVKNLFLNEIEGENGKSEKITDYNINLNISSILSAIKNQNKIKQNDYNNIYVSDLYLNLFNGKLHTVHRSSPSIVKKEKCYKCCLVKPTHHIMGTLYFKEKEIVFVYGDQSNKLSFYNHNKNDLNYDESNGTCFGSFFILYRRDKDTLKLRIPYNMINLVFKRSYFYRANAIEIFTSNQKSYYIHFMKHEDRKSAMNEFEQHFAIKDNIKMLPSKTDYIFGIVNKARKFKSKKIYATFSEMFKKWHDHNVSSFEFLMWCNIFANRSYRDLTQYPVFPWTIIDYTSSKLDLAPLKDDNASNEINFLRDFSKPMGMLDVGPKSKKRIELIKEEYKNMKYTAGQGDSDDEEEVEEEKTNYIEKIQEILKKKQKKIKKIKDNNQIPHFYSTHYSNPIYVSHYLCRLFPFSQLRIELQGEKFDVAERLFSSIETTFESATTQKTDVRELIPEFYYLPEMFENINNLNIGIKNSNVVLPLWAHNKTYKFVSKLRKVLESDKAQFNYWINLIFGSCQLGDKAIEACNLFSNSSYYSTFNVESVKDIQLAKYYMRYAEVGLTPSQIFSGDSPLRQALVFHQITTLKKEERSSRNSSKKDKTNHYLQKVPYVKASLNNPYIGGIFSPIAFKFIQKEINKRDYTLVFFNENFYRFYIKIDSPSKTQNLVPINIEKQVLSSSFLSGKINYRINNPPVLLLFEGRVIIQGGFWDGTLIIYYKGKEGQKSKIIHNKIDKSPIVYIINDQDENFIVAGTKKGSVLIYDISDIITRRSLKIFKKLNNHTDEISCLSINENLQVLGTASFDLYVNIYTMIDFKLINSVQVNLIPHVLTFCSSPLPSFIVIQESLKAAAFTINGTPIEKIQNIPQTEGRVITSFCTFRDHKAKEYIVLGFSNGVIEIRRLPSLAIQEVFQDPKTSQMKMSLKVAISPDAQFIVAHGNGELYIVTNIDALNHNASNNLANLGF